MEINAGLAGLKISAQIAALGGAQETFCRFVELARMRLPRAGDLTLGANGQPVAPCSV